MATPTQGRRGKQGIPGPPGPAGKTGKGGRTGATGQVGARGATGAKGSTSRSPGGKGRRRLLASVERHIENIYGDLAVQMQRLARLQLQVDELRAKIRRV